MFQRQIPNMTQIYTPLAIPTQEVAVINIKIHGMRVSRPMYFNISNCNFLGWKCQRSIYLGHVGDLPLEHK